MGVLGEATGEHGPGRAAAHHHEVVVGSQRQGSEVIEPPMSRVLDVRSEQHDGHAHQHHEADTRSVTQRYARRRVQTHRRVVHGRHNA